MPLEDRLKRCRIQKKMTQQELSEKVGCSRSSIINWERGTRTPDADVLKKLADALGVSVAYLLEESKSNEAAPTNHNIILVPLLSDVTRACCGMGNGYEFPDDTIEGRLAVDVDALGPIRTNGMFACRVEGDSMAAARIYDGDIIVVAPEEEPIDGDVVLACYGAHQRWMIRWFYAQRDGSIILKAANPEYPDIKITPEDVDCGWYRYLGKVIAYQGSPKKGI